MNIAALRKNWTRTCELWISFASLCLLTLAILWHPFASTIAQALRDDEFTHILLILPTSASLILLEWRGLKSGLSPNVRAGSLLVTAALFIAVLTRLWSVWPEPDVQLAISMLALVMSWIAAFVLCFGASVARSLLFPLCFLFWMVPIPAFALVRIVQLWQRGSALAAWCLFSAVNVPSIQDGVFISIPGLNLEVAPECSSLRSSLMLLVTTMVLAHLLLRTPWRKTILILLAIPLSIAKNGLRIFTIGILTTRVDRSFLTGRLHHEGGMVFFLIALAGVLVLLWLLRRGEGRVAHVPSLDSGMGARERLG